MSDSTLDRLDRARVLIDQCLASRASGDAVSDQALIDSHPELKAELEQEFGRLRRQGRLLRQRRQRRPHQRRLRHQRC